MIRFNVFDYSKEYGKAPSGQLQHEVHAVDVHTSLWANG